VVEAMVARKTAPLYREKVFASSKKFKSAAKIAGDNLPEAIPLTQ
jgi:hypothetical protein